MMKLSTVLKKVQKIYESQDTPLDFYWRQRFFTRDQKILQYQEMQIQVPFWYITSNSFNFFESLKIVLINRVTILMMPAKMATLGLLKIMIIWNKGYNVIIFVHDITNKILSRGSNYIVDVIMWQKFGNSSLSMKEVIITTIL